jgi:uncharacterized protein with von Willebrand factor type A (vWA) domain
MERTMGNFDFESGRRFMTEGDLVEGIRSFLASLDVDPDHAQTYVELFKAYECAWDETGDPEILDQMRKVAIAGLKREPADEQRRFLQEGLDRTEERIVSVQRAEEELERQERARGRRLPLFTSGS